MYILKIHVTKIFDNICRPSLRFPNDSILSVADQGGRRLVMTSPWSCKNKSQKCSQASLFILVSSCQVFGPATLGTVR